MKSFKELFESNKILEENIQSFLKKKFKNDKEFTRLKKAAKKNTDDIPDFLDYVYNILGETGIEDLSKKYKLDMDDLAIELLK